MRAHAASPRAVSRPVNVTDAPALVPASTVQNDANVRYPDFLQRRLRKARIPLVTVDEGISGNRVLQGGAIPQFGPAAVDRIEADGTDIPGATNAIILEGINDLGVPPWPTAAQLETGYRALIRALHAKGIHVLLGTINNIENVDMNEAAVSVTSLQTQLEASYRVTALLSQLSLVNFLR